MGSSRLYSVWRVLGTGFLEVGVDDDVDAVVGEIDGAGSKAADFDGAFAAGGQDERKVNFFFDAFCGIKEFEWLE